MELTTRETSLLAESLDQLLDQFGWVFARARPNVQYSDAYGVDYNLVYEDFGKIILHEISASPFFSVAKVTEGIIRGTLDVVEGDYIRVYQRRMPLWDIRPLDFRVVQVSEFQLRQTQFKRLTLQPLQEKYVV